APPWPAPLRGGADPGAAGVARGALRHPLHRAAPRGPARPAHTQTGSSCLELNRGGDCLAAFTLSTGDTMNLKQKYLSNLRGDLFGGVTAGIVALPLALAFGVASGLGAEAGLYGAIAVGIIAALFGGTPS